MAKEQFDELYEAILNIKDVEEARAFFDDLCTVKELESMLGRVKAAKMLLDGKTYVEVEGETKISSATLSRVSKCVRYGDGGYKAVLEKTKKE